MPGLYEEFEFLIEVGDITTAEKLLFDWIRDHPNDAYGWLLYGKCVNNPPQKQSCYQRVLALDPSNMEAKELLKQIDTVFSPNQPPSFLNKEEINNSDLKIASSFPIDKSKKQAEIPSAQYINDTYKVRLTFVFYSLIHLLFTILLGVGIILSVKHLIPTLFSTEKTKNTFLDNWISDSNSSNISPEQQEVANIFLNPSSLDFHEVSSYQELNHYSNSIAIDPNKPTFIKFQGVSFIGQLIGGRVLNYDIDGKPVVIIMDVLFNEVRIPVIYYGSTDVFKFQDKLHVQGVFIKEGSTVVAQHIEQLSSKASTQPNQESLIMLRFALLVLVWTIFCISILVWRINLKKWRHNITSLFLPRVTPSLLLLLSVFLTSCTINLSTTLEKDGTGITSILVHESKENLNFLRSVPGLSNYISAVITQVENSGAMFEQYAQGDQEVFYLQRYLNNTSAGAGSTFPLQESWVYIQQYQEGGEEVLRFLAVVDTRSLYNNTNALGADVSDALQDELDQINLTYHLITPGKLAYHNGKEEINRQVTWQLRMNDINYLVAESRFPKEVNAKTTSYSLYAWIILVTFFSISTLSLIISIWIFPTKNKTEGGV